MKCRTSPQKNACGVARIFLKIFCEPDDRAIAQHSKTKPIMKKVSILSLLALIISLSSCRLAGGIFKAGFNMGIIVVIAVVAIIIFILAKVLGGGSR